MTEISHHSFKRLLAYVYVCEERNNVFAPILTLSPNLSLRELVLTSIERLLREKGYGKDVLTDGYCLVSPDPFAMSCGAHVECRYPNSCVNRLFYPEWERLLSRIGGSWMAFMLQNTSMFYQVTQSCMIQISGTPFNSIAEAVAHTNCKIPSKLNPLHAKAETDPTGDYNTELKAEKVKKTGQSSLDTDGYNSREKSESGERGKVNLDMKYRYDADSSNRITDGDGVNDDVGNDDVKEKNDEVEKGTGRKQDRYILDACIRHGERQTVFGKVNDVAKGTRIREHTDIRTNGRKQTRHRKRKKEFQTDRKSLKSGKTGRKRKKYEEIHDERFQELRERSMAFASKVGMTDGKHVTDLDGPGGSITVQEKWKELNPRKRKLSDTHFECNDMEEVGDMFESKRRRLQNENFSGIKDDLTFCRDLSDKEVYENVTVSGKKELNPDENKKGKNPATNRAKKLGKAERTTNSKDDLISFCPFEFQLPLPRNRMLFSRNPRERFSKSALFTRLNPTEQDTVLLYKEIFCETQVLSDNKILTVTAPDLRDVQTILSSPDDQNSRQGSDGSAIKHENTYLYAHQSFWTDSNKQKTDVSGVRDATVSSGSQNVGTKGVFEEFDIETDVKHGVSLPDIRSLDKENISVQREMYSLIELKGSDDKLPKFGCNYLKLEDSAHCGNVAPSPNIGMRGSCEKEKLLARRKNELLLSRRKAKMSKCSCVCQRNCSCETKVDKNFDGGNCNNACCISPCSATVNSSQNKSRFASQHSGQNLCASQHSVHSLCASQLPVHNGCTSQHSVQSLCTSQHSVQNLYASQHSVQNLCASQHSVQNLYASQHSVQNQSTSPHSVQNQSTGQYSLQGMFTSQHSSQHSCASQHRVQSLYSSQHTGQNICASQHSVQCSKRQPIDIPAFPDVKPLLKQLIENHQMCPFRALLNHHCPAMNRKTASRFFSGRRKDLHWTSKSLTVSQLLSNHHQHRKVYLFVRACIVRVLPVELLGTKQNLNIFLRSVSKIISLGKYDRLTLGQLMHGMKTASVDWLNSTNSNGVKLHMLAKLLHWLFGYILMMLKTFFYVTDTGFLRYRLLYYRQLTWNKLQLLGIQGLFKRKIFKVVSERRVLDMLYGKSSLGISVLRFLPKQQSLRPIINLGSVQKIDAFQTQSVNKQLLDLHSILKYLKNHNPSLIGYGKLGTDDIYEAWKSFVQEWRDIGSPKLYFVKTDITNCYDSVSQSKLYSILENILDNEIGDEEYVIRKYFTVSLRNGGVKKKFHRVVTTLTEFVPDFVSYCKEEIDKKGLCNTIFVDKVVYQHETRETLKVLLKQHLFNNLIKVGNNYCVQTDGISQGSVISTLLCSFYYADMEKKLLELKDGEFLMRIVDDYLYVTPSRERAISFVETMIEGIPEYNCSTNMEKNLTNFVCEVNNSILPNVSSEWFPWCGVLVNTNTLEVCMDFSKYCGYSMKDTMTMELSKAPGKSLKEKIMFSVRHKCHALFIDDTINSKRQMLANLYQQFLLAAFKLHTYIQKLHYKQRAESNTRFFIGVITEIVHTVRCLVGKCLGENGNGMAAMIRWLCLKACCVKFASHNAQYRPLLKELKKQLKHSQENLTEVEKMLLTDVVDPAMPEAFQYCLT